MAILSSTRLRVYDTAIFSVTTASDPIVVVHEFKGDRKFFEYVLNAKQ